MRLNYIALGFIIHVMLPSGCREARMSEQTDHQAVPDTTIRYAKRFAVARKGSETYVYLRGDRNSMDTTDVFILSRTRGPALTGNGEFIVRIPCTNVAALSSIYAQALFELRELDALAAIDNSDYVTNKEVLERISSAHLPELAKTPFIDVEKTLLLDPDIVFTFGMGDGSEPDERLKRAGIPVAVSVDHLEETPLARAEWIRFFSEFVDRRSLADSLFAVTEKEYINKRSLASRTAARPTVFCEIKYSDAWYMPGGKSYVATLLRDAGARYLWEDDQHTGSLPLSFEEVYSKARDADFWIHLSLVRTREELLSYEQRYASFRAFKTGNLFNNTRHTNSKGYSNYWESGMLHPERILSDLVSIFHPELGNQNMYYYEKVR